MIWTYLPCEGQPMAMFFVALEQLSVAVPFEGKILSLLYCNNIPWRGV